MAFSSPPEVPSSILIVGSGVFGLGTAWSLCKNPLFKDTQITLVDRSQFPSPDGSSIDTSRIIRPDYADAPYARLATAAQTLWRTTFAPEHYHETGLAVTGSGPEQKYVYSSLANVRAIGTDKVEELASTADIQRACGLETNVPTPEKPAGGNTGYINWSSGWADAEGAMRWLYEKVEKLNRVRFVTATVKRVLIDHNTSTVSGVLLSDNSTLTASLTVLATGAWTPALLDLRGICKATGQALVYLPISDTEQAQVGDKPTLLNLSSGMFIITPSNNMLKIARHGHGYVNPTTISHPEAAPSNTERTITVSLPYTHVDGNTQDVLPMEAQIACREFLSSIHPSLSKASRPFTKTRICWYNDTPHHDFLVSYHPTYKGLFVATGGSGHAFKFLPVIGDAVVECLLGKTPEDFREKWKWPRERVPEKLWEGDGSRGGPVGMVLAEELEKGRKSKL